MMKLVSQHKCSILKWTLINTIGMIVFRFLSEYIKFFSFFIMSVDLIIGLIAPFYLFCISLYVHLPQIIMIRKISKNAQWWAWALLFSYPMSLTIFYYSSELIGSTLNSPPDLPDIVDIIIFLGILFLPSLFLEAKYLLNKLRFSKVYLITKFGILFSIGYVMIYYEGKFIWFLVYATLISFVCQIYVIYFYRFLASHQGRTFIRSIQLGEDNQHLTLKKLKSNRLLQYVLLFQTTIFIMVFFRAHLVFSGARRMHNYHGDQAVGALFSYIDFFLQGLRDLLILAVLLMLLSFAIANRNALRRMAAGLWLLTGFLFGVFYFTSYPQVNWPYLYQFPSFSGAKLNHPLTVTILMLGFSLSGLILLVDSRTGTPNSIPS